MRFARRLIKGTMGTEGIMGLFPEIPIIPAFPEIPENSPKKAKPFNKTHLPKRTTPISYQKRSDATLISTTTPISC